MEVTCKKASEEDAKKVNAQSSAKDVKAKTVKSSTATYASKASHYAAEERGFIQWHCNLHQFQERSSVYGELQDQIGKV